MKKSWILNTVWSLLLVVLCSFKAPESELAHQFLDGLSGIQIGANAADPYGLNVLNVDYSFKMTPSKQAQIDACGSYAKVDIIANGDELPIEDDSFDFVLCSHVLEYFKDPIKAIKEWLRIVKPGGYVYMVIPHHDRSANKEMPRTTLKELLQRHDVEFSDISDRTETHSYWIPKDIIELCDFHHWNIYQVVDEDDKNGDCFVIILKKTVEETPQ